MFTTTATGLVFSTKKCQKHEKFQFLPFSSWFKSEEIIRVLQWWWFVWAKEEFKEEALEFEDEGADQQRAYGCGFEEEDWEIMEGGWKSDRAKVKNEKKVFTARVNKSDVDKSPNVTFLAFFWKVALISREQRCFSNKQVKKRLWYSALSFSIIMLKLFYHSTHSRSISILINNIYV